MTVDLASGTGFGADGQQDSFTSIETILGSAGNDMFTGDAENNFLGGAAGNDTLDGGAGSDILQGGSGADIFVFGDNSGSDVVVDFEDGIDLLDVSGLSGVTSFEDLTLIDAGGSRTIVTDSEGNSIQLNNVNIEQITAEDFIF